MTGTYFVYLFLGVSVLSLVVTLFVARQVIGSDIGAPRMQKVAGVIQRVTVNLF